MTTENPARRRRIVGNVVERFTTVMVARLDMAMGDKGPSNPEATLARFRTVVAGALTGFQVFVAAPEDDPETFLCSFLGEKHAREAAKGAKAVARELRFFKPKVDGKIDWSVALATGPLLTTGEGDRARVVGTPVEEADDLLDPHLGVVAAVETWRSLGEMQPDFKKIDDEDLPCYQLTGL